MYVGNICVVCASILDNRGLSVFFAIVSTIICLSESLQIVSNKVFQFEVSHLSSLQSLLLWLP